jgi:hypothetical protein
VLSATIQSPGSSPITAAGIACGPNPNPDVTGSTVPTDAASGSFQVHLEGLTPNTPYHFRGYATNSTGTAYTTDAAFTTIPDAPAATAATGVSSTGFTANWTAPAGTGYIVEYRLDVSADSRFHSLLPGYSNLPVFSLSRTVTGIVGGKNYYYRVRAVNDGGTSGNSTTIGVATPTAIVIRVTSPVGGETWTAGSKHAITWTYLGNTGSKVNIELLEAGSVAALIKSGASIGSNGTGSYSWTIPSSLTAESGCAIRVTSVSNPSCSGESAQVFSIAEPNK